MSNNHKVKKQKSRAGGARPGAGRHALIENKARKPVTITAEMEEKIEGLLDQHLPSFSQFMCAATLARLKRYKSIPDTVPPRKRADYKKYSDQLTVSKMVDLPDDVPGKIERLGFYVSPFVCTATEQYIASLQKKKKRAA